MKKQAQTGHSARILTRVWRQVLVASILMCSVSAVSWAQVSIDGAFSPPDATDTTAHMQQAQSLRQDYSSTPIALRITLPEVTDAEHADWEGRERTVPLQIGFGREIPTAWQDDLAPRLTWTTLSDGSVVSALSVTSPGARALRVAVYASLDPGAELRFSGPADLDQRFDPLTQSDFVPQASESAAVDDPLLSDPPMWSPVIEGETAWIEVSLPSSAALSTFSLYVDQVSHLLQSMRTPQSEPRSISTPHQYAPQHLAQIEAASCDNHIDVQCRIEPGPQDVDLTLSKLRINASATAKMIFTINAQGDSGICTGTLLEDSDDTTDIPYFLTAHHCISTEAVARTLVTYWDFELTPCGGHNPSEVIQRDGGALLLATDPDSDSALLRLRGTPPPSGERPRRYAGWSSRRSSPHIAVYGVHHPAGDLKKYSAGVILRESIFEHIGGQRVDGLHVVWSEGTMEPGSSGSGLFDADGNLRGVASAVPPDDACPIIAGYGRFDRFFPLISNYLGPEEETPDDETPDDRTPDDDHENTPERATSVKSTSFTSGTLERQGDVDYFRVHVDQAGTLTVETTGGTDTVGQLRGADDQRLSDDDDRGLGLNFRIVQSVSAGTYYIRVNGFESAPGEVATGPYTLVAHFTPTPTDDHGNTREKARSVKPNSSTPGTLERQGDIDYFRVHVDQAGTLTVETTGGTDTVGQLRGADGQWLSEDDDGGSRLNFRLVEFVSAGTYYIRVSGFESPGEVATGPYTLVLRFTPAPTDDHGNTREKARSVKPNSSTPGTLERQGDIDYFRVHVDQAGTLTVETTGDTDTVGQLRGADGQWLSEDDDGGSRLNFRLVESVSAGTYYIRVSGFDNATGRYTLKVQLQ